jgi:hypothetical protein
MAAALCAERAGRPIPVTSQNSYSISSERTLMI